MDRFVIRLLVIFAIAAGAASFAIAQNDDPELPFRTQRTAPEINGGKSWLNIDKPLTLAGLRGKVVLLDFWTYGCINCIHVIPDLKKLEAKYPKNLVVIGVHSAKFDNEGETDNIRNIIVRYKVEHPVVNDSDFRIWNKYGISAYPTRIIIDPDGLIIGRFVGEGDYNEIDFLIGETIKNARPRGKLNETPLKLALERAKIGDLPLSFPGKILADPVSKRLFISDSGHNRIVVTDLDGKLLGTIGNGAAGASDGDFDNSKFNQPQGLAIDGEFLYVADRENHLIRRVDLGRRTVETIAGTGIVDDFNNLAGIGREAALRSPWDLAILGQHLFVAMAGSHQIWRMDLKSRFLEPFAGNRFEARTDGRRLNASFAQPSGLTILGNSLVVADSESNIIRGIDLEKESVATLAGGDLYKFGDTDGTGNQVRLQHPLGVFALDGKILIADTYNHRIKSLDPATRTVRTLFGTGKPGQADGILPTFYEPAGLSVADGRLFIADTNNHAVRVVDLKTRIVSTLMISGLKAPAEVEPADESGAANRESIAVAPREFAANGTNELLLDLAFPKGFHLNPNAPHRIEITVESPGTTERTVMKFASLPFKFPLKLAASPVTLTAKMTFTYCREDNTGVCRIKTLVWTLPLIPTTQKPAARIELTAAIE